MTANSAGADPGEPPTAEPDSDRGRVLVAHPGAELYGADRVFLESVRALSAQFDVTVVLPERGPLCHQLQSLGVSVALCPMPVLRNAALRPRGVARLVRDALRGAIPALRLLRRHGVVGVYVNTVTIPWWPALARLVGRRSLCHVHEAELSRPRIVRRILALGPVLADRVVVNSTFTLDVLADVAPRVRARTTVVYNAVRGPGEVVAPRRRLEGPLRLLFLGRLSPRKGPQIALAALRELRTRGVDARLDVVGSVYDGYEWFEAELRRTVEAWGLTDSVDFLGFRPVVWPHLAAADVVLVPSIAEESFGNVAVEAVLAGRPVLVSDSSGLREAVAGYGGAQVVAPGQPERWADAIQRVMSDWHRFRAAVLEDAGRAAARHAPQRYADRLVQAMSALPATGRALLAPTGETPR